MTKAPDHVTFNATLSQPATPKAATWTFLVLPVNASAKLPSRGMTTVDGTLNGVPFRATLEPDGANSHWLKVSRKVRLAANATAGDVVELRITAADEQAAPRMPADFRKALAANAKALAVWTDITPIARRDWIHWIVSAKKPETRARRIDSACSMLAGGKRRVCCFDRSGMYSRSMSAPEAAR